MARFNVPSQRQLWRHSGWHHSPNNNNNSNIITKQLGNQVALTGRTCLIGSLSRNSFSLSRSHNYQLWFSLLQPIFFIIIKKNLNNKKKSNKKEK